MKTIQLTLRQRQDIGERRRHAPDRRVYQRTSAVLGSDDGRTREEIAELLGVSTRQVGQWLRIARNQGLDELCTLHYTVVGPILPSVRYDGLSPLGPRSPSEQRLSSQAGG